MDHGPAYKRHDRRDGHEQISGAPIREVGERLVQMPHRLPRVGARRRFGHGWEVARGHEHDARHGVVARSADDRTVGPHERPFRESDEPTQVGPHLAREDRRAEVAIRATGLNLAFRVRAREPRNARQPVAKVIGTDLVNLRRAQAEGCPLVGVVAFENHGVHELTLARIDVAIVGECVNRIVDVR